jgi:ligand-binding SRPBCC domain-containing protein
MTNVYRLIRQQFIPAPIERVWAYFATPANLNEMTPPDLDFEIVCGGEPSMYEGQIIEYRVRFLPFVRSLWLTEIVHVTECRSFVDEQRLGPYRFWYHEHLFEPVEGGVQMTDRLTYALLFGALGDLVHALWVRRKLEHIFDFRRQKVAQIFG